MSSLKEGIERAIAADTVPMHMPGHKRNPGLAGSGNALFGNASETPGIGGHGRDPIFTDVTELGGHGRDPIFTDVTELGDTDDLHDPRGILRSAMERTASLYGADRTWYLVNGSTCGILAGIRALVPAGSEVLCARNCHRSVFHAIELCGLRAHWVMPEYIEEYEIYGSLPPERVREAVSVYPDCRAVILTSPTYEGVISDISGIAEICHSRGIPLIVDEAHGAHLGLNCPGEAEGCGTGTGSRRDNPAVTDGSGTEEALCSAGRPAGHRLCHFPPGAVSCGADLVIQSPHKTLTSLTQSAWMHLKGGLADPGEIGRQLDIFETSSPSYPLMISLDECTELFTKRGGEILSGWLERIEDFNDRTSDIDGSRMRIFGSGDPGGGDPSFPPAVFERDPSKILIRSKDPEWTGKRLYEILSRDYGIRCEMYSGMNVLAMTGAGDRDDALIILSDALHEISGRMNPGPAETGSGELPADREVPSGFGDERTAPRTARSALEGPSGAGGEAYPAETRRFALRATEDKRLPENPESILSIAGALKMPRRMIPLSDAVGLVSAEYVWCYPPGIPLLVPGECVSPSVIKRFRSLIDSGTSLHFSLSGDDPETVYVVD